MSQCLHFCVAIAFPVETQGKYSMMFLKGFLPEKEGHDLRVAIENRNHERGFLGMIWDFDLSPSVDKLVKQARTVLKDTGQTQS